MENKMTIHRALAELKLIDAKIEKQTDDIKPVGIYQKGKNVNGITPLADFEKSATSSYDSIIALIDRKQKIKSAIVKANAVTEVIIAGETMTIADAITLKTIIRYKRILADRLRARFNNAAAELNRNNSVVDQNAQKLLEAAFGKDNTKINASDTESIQKPYTETNGFHLADPLKVEDKIKELEDKVGAFEAEVDAVLSEINAITFIEL